jgi:hypothetical protein
MFVAYGLHYAPAPEELIVALATNESGREFKEARL